MQRIPGWHRWAWFLWAGAVWFAMTGAVKGQPVPGQVLVKMRAAGAGGRLQGGAALQLPAGARELKALPMRGWHLVQLPAGQALAAGMAWFRERPEVAWVEPNHRYRLHATPADPQWPWLSGLTQIGAPAAWDVSVGRSSVVAAVLDTGIDTLHPDLQANLWRNPGEVPGNGVDDDENGIVDDVFGADFADDDADPTDDAGHGTHVAGTIGAVANNGIGGAGVCWQVQLLTVRVGRADGFGDTVALASAFAYVVRLKRAGADVRVINCSWGGGFPSVMLKEAIIEAGEAGILIVCSAGNDRQDNDVLPAFPSGYDCPQILSVAASTSCDDLANFSNHGRRTVHLAAPGRDILSTYRGGGRYAVLSGTSMASPHVSGAAALLAAYRPELTADQLRTLILESVDRHPGLTNRVVSGGRLNVARAMARLQAGDIPAPGQGPGLVLAEGRITPATRLPNGRWARDDSSEPVLSADGRWLAFTSAATNLVPRMDATDFVHVFLQDRWSNAMVRVSQTPAGVGGTGNSSAPAISADGRFVAFASRASNLAPGDSNGTLDVFVWSRETGAVEVVSVRADGLTSGNGPSDVPTLSADGGVVVFQSEARDLVTGDRNAQPDVFLRDRSRRVTERVSVTSGGLEANGPSEAPSVSADGRVVAFHSGASNLVAADGNRVWDVFVRDRVTGITEVASVSGAGTAGDSDSVFPILSADGLRVMFHSLAANFDTRGGGFIGVFVRDRTAGTLVRANARPGTVAGGDAYVDGFSGNGRYVCFTSDDPTLGPGGLPGLFRAWMYDRLSGTIGQIGVNEGGYNPDNNTYFGRPNGDGRFVAFASYASNPVAGNGNGLGNVYVEDLGEARPDLGVRPGGDAGLAYAGLGTVHPAVPQRAGVFVERGRTGVMEAILVNGGEARSFRLGMSWTGTTATPGWVVRVTPAAGGGNIVETLIGTGWVTPLLPAGSNLVLRIEIDRIGSNLGASLFAPRLTASAVAGGPVLDAVTAAAETSPAVPGHELVSRAFDGTPSGRNAEAASVSRNGRSVVFSSEADHLESRMDTNYQSDVFLYDRGSRTVSRISDASPTDQANADSRYPSISADGRRVAFQSRASNLVTSDTNDVEDVFVKDLQTGGVTRASVSAAGQQGNRGSEFALLTADGLHLAFTSLASNLVPGDTNQSQDVFVRDLESGALECISRPRSGGVGDADSEVVAISGDGRFVLFNSYASNLGPPDANAMMDVYLLDRAGGELELVSAGTNGVAANGASRGSSISDDGLWVTFSSLATDLGAGAVEPGRNGFVLHRLTRQVRVAERHVPMGSIGRIQARGVVVSPDGASWGVAARGACGSLPAADQVVVFRRSPQTGMEQATLVSRQAGETPGEDHSFVGRFSADSRYLTFESYAANVLGEFTRGAGQILLADTAIPGVGSLARRIPDGTWRDGDDLNPATRTITVPVGGGEAVSGRYGVRVRNTGTMPERLVISAIRPASGFARILIEALVIPRQDITEAVFGEGWTTPILQPEETLEMDVTLALVADPVSDGALDFVVRWGSERYGDAVARLVALADRDLDGLPDGWENRWFGTLARTGSGTDLDGDGMSDRAEWEAGTVPADRHSNLRLSITGPEDGFGPSVSWWVEPGRYYVLERSRDGGVFEVVYPLAAGLGVGRMHAIRLQDWEHPDGTVLRLRVELP